MWMSHWQFRGIGLLRSLAEMCKISASKCCLVSGVLFWASFAWASYPQTKPTGLWERVFVASAAQMLQPALTDPTTNSRNLYFNWLGIISEMSRSLLTQWRVKWWHEFHIFCFPGVQHEELHLVLPEGAERTQRQAGQRRGGGAPQQGSNLTKEHLCLQYNIKC